MIVSPGELPKPIGNLGKLEALHLSGNPLMDWPTAIHRCNNLKHLDLSRCRISEVGGEHSWHVYHSRGVLLIYTSGIKGRPLVFIHCEMVHNDHKHRLLCVGRVYVISGAFMNIGGDNFTLNKQFIRLKGRAFRPRELNAPPVPIVTSPSFLHVQIPDSISSLKKLDYICLSNNRIHTIPQGMCDLKVVEIDLNSNDIAGFENKI